MSTATYTIRDDRLIAEQIKEAIAVKHDDNQLLRLARAGDKRAITRTKELIESELSEQGIEYDIELIQNIFNASWGLGPIQHLYDDPSVNEIWVNGSGENVWYEKNGRRLKAQGVIFRSDEEVEEIQERILSNENKEINLRQSTVESKMLDGSRITMTRPYETPYPTITIRKHNQYELTTDRLIEHGTFNNDVLRLLQRLVNGRANILIIGPTSSGKTSLLRWLTQFIPKNLRIGVLETTYELALDKYLEGQNVITFEEQPTIGRTILKQFHTMLHLSPDIVILGEVRGSEADQLIKTFRRGHPGSMGTIHSNSPEASIQDLVDMIMEDGRNWGQEHLYLRVARSVDVVIQMHNDPDTGTRRLLRITEIVCPETSNDVQFRDLCVYTGKTWELKHDVSPALEKKLAMFSPEKRTVVGG